MNRMTAASAALVGIALTLLVGCETPADRPTTPPQPQTPPPPPSETQAREQQQPASGGREADSAKPSAPDSAPDSAAAPADASPAPPESTAPPDSVAPPPSAAPADVEITDIPVDEDGNPIVQESPASTGAPTPAGRQQAGTQSGGGGSPTPPDETGTAAAGARSSGGTEAPGDTINVGAMTSTERSASLERDLEARLAKFDELMRKAREEAERERGGGYAGSPDGAGSRTTPPPDGSGQGGQADTSSGLGHTPDITGTTRPGTYRHPTGPTPVDIPDAPDDDIVARQLREAASREADPVLREKLWEEYRKYKQGIGR